MAKTRGSHVLNAVKVLRSQRARSLALLPARMHKYLDELILPSTWYPFDDHLELLRVIGLIFSPGAPIEVAFRQIGRGTANSDLTGLYKTSLRRGDATGTMRWMMAMWKNVFDVGELTVKPDGPHGVTVRLRDFPLRTREICSLCSGYIVETVQLAIDREPKLVHSTCRARGDHECAWSVSWA